MFGDGLEQRITFLHKVDVDVSNISIKSLDKEFLDMTRKAQTK